MPNLGDFLGHLMSEITIAKMQADLESIRIAELYSSHPLLVHMPIPHFRLPNVDIEVPVIVKEMEEQEAGQTVRGSPTVMDMSGRVDPILDRLSQKESITIKAELRSKIRKAVNAKFEQLRLPGEIGINLNQMANELADTVSDFLTMEGGPVKKSERRKIRRSVKDLAKNEFTILFKPVPRLKVLVTSSELRGSGSSDFITRIHLKINEEGFEWKTIQSDEGTNDKLVPE